MMAKIDQRVEVLTVYDISKGAMPFKIKWNGRVYRVQGMPAYQRKRREGRIIIHVFNVSTESIDMQLELNSESLHWTLKEVSDGTSD